MTTQTDLHEFAAIFRCSPDMSPVYLARIHERMGHEVPMGDIFAAMKKIAPKRLSMETIVAQLRKMERGPSRRRAVKADDAEGGSRASAGQDADPRRAQPPAASGKLTTLGRIEMILAANWERGRQHGLKPEVMPAERFVKSARSIAGTPKPSVARVVQAILRLDKREVLLTPNLVADEINESGE